MREDQQEIRLRSCCASTRATYFFDWEYLRGLTSSLWPNTDARPRVFFCNTAGIAACFLWDTSDRVPELRESAETTWNLQCSGALFQRPALLPSLNRQITPVRFGMVPLGQAL